MARRRGRRRPANQVFVGGRPFKPSIPDPDFVPVDIGQAKEGWRAWSISKELPAYGLPPKLNSVTHQYAWTPKRKAEAECGYCEEGEGVPGVSCSCGFYSAKSLRHLMQMGYHTYADIDESKSFKIVGQVANWGKVIEGTQGWRSQYSYPVYLMLPFEMGATFGERIRDAYGCKVRLLNFLKAPHEITDELLADLLAGRPHMVLPAKQSSKGRRLGHKQLRFLGHAVSDTYEHNGKQVIDVIWDVTPDRTVPIPLDQVEFEAR